MNQPDFFDKHAALIGRVTIAWNSTHEMVFFLFKSFTGLHDRLAESIFFATRSDAGRREIVSAVGKIVLDETPALLTKFTETMSLLTRLAAERNAAIHTNWVLTEPFDDDDEPTRVRPNLARRRHGALRDDFVSQFVELDRQLRHCTMELAHILIAYENKPT